MRSRIAASVLLLSLLAGCGGGGKDRSAENPGGGTPPETRAETSFVLAVIPDTQFLSENNKRGFLNLDPRYPDLPYEPALAFYAMTDWLAREAGGMRIPFVIHVGDVVQKAGERQQEWDVASKAMTSLEKAGVPYSIAPGNHDVRDQDQMDNERWHFFEGFLRNFGPERAASKNPSTFIRRDTLGYSEAHIFSALGQKFLVLALSWRPSDTTLVWAQQMISGYADLPVILMSHDIVSVNGEGAPVLTESGERLWEKIINRNRQVFMTISGHNHYAARVRRHNASGDTVDLVLADYQSEYAGGNGLLRLLEFDLAAGSVEAYTFSPWVLQKLTVPAYQGYYVPCAEPHISSNCDQLAPVENIGKVAGEYYDNQYRFDIDFRARFASFNGFTADVGRQPQAASRLDALRATLDAVPRP